MKTDHNFSTEPLEWWGYMTNLDLEIVCNHKDKFGNWVDGYIQISEIDDNGSIFRCSKCGKQYMVKLSVEPIEETI